MTGKLLHQPVHTFIKPLASDRAALINRPVPVLNLCQAEHLADILFGGSIRQVLLVSQDE